MVIKKASRTAPKLKTLDAYLSSTPEPSTATAPIDKIRLPTKQPRHYFDPDKLAQLAMSIKEHGILEPLLVRPTQEGEYELVAGERRLRAARDVGLTEVPIVVRTLDDQQALQIALMENLQREDLNPIEETEAILDLLALTLESDRREVVSLLYQSYNAQQRGQELNQNVLIQLEKAESLLSEIGRFNVGTFRSSRLPLLKLPQDVLTAVRNGELEYTKAQAIARVKDGQERAALLRQVRGEGLPLSEIRARARELQPPPEPTPESILAERWGEIGKRLRQGQGLSDRKKRARILKLLDELERLTTENP